MKHTVALLNIVTILLLTLQTAQAMHNTEIAQALLEKELYEEVDDEGWQIIPKSVDATADHTPKVTINDTKLAESLGKNDIDNETMIGESNTGQPGPMNESLNFEYPKKPKWYANKFTTIAAAAIGTGAVVACSTFLILYKMKNKSSI